MYLSSRKKWLQSFVLVISLTLLWTFYRVTSSIDPGNGGDNLPPPPPATSGNQFSGSKTRTFPYGDRLFANNRLQQTAVEFMPKNSRGCRKWGVLTTVFPPAESVRRLRKRSDWCVVVVGDLQAPDAYEMSNGDNVIFLSAEHQTLMNSEFVDFLPWRSFGRKNVGYLFAVGQGAEVIWDFDDDNMLKFWLEGASPDHMLDIDQVVGTVMDKTTISVSVPQQRQHGAFNPYPHLGCQSSPCWPRGLPLHAIKEDNLANLSTVMSPTDRIGIMQSLADHDPDIDAIFRLTRHDSSPMYFSRNKPPTEEILLLHERLFSPLNAQAALHFKSAFFALYLPVTVNGRVSDIWRGYAAQALLSLSGLQVGFLPRPLVVQKRNPHSHEADFAAEMPLYTKTGALLQFLAKWLSEVTASTMEQAVEDLYVELYQRDFIELEDVRGVQLWLKALNSVGYRLPALLYQEGAEGRTVLEIDKINLRVGSPVKTPPSGKLLPNKCLSIENKHFWTSDLHDGTRMDLSTQLASLGQTVVLAGIKGNVVPHPEVLNRSGVTVYGNISPILRKYNGHSSQLTISDVKRNHKYYMGDQSIASTDAFVCSFPSSMCELWAPFNKSIVFLPAHRYNLGRCSPPEYERLNAWLLALAQKEQNVIGAMSRYDLEYLHYHLDLKHGPRLISSLSGFHSDRHGSYTPTRKEVLVIGEKLEEMPEHYRSLVTELQQQQVNLFVPLRTLYPKYDLSDLVKHPAIVLLPYSVMSYKLTEFYSLGIPLFVPSPKYLREHGGLGPDRTTSSPPYCSVGSGVMPKNPASAHPYSPNVDFVEDPEAEMYWLQFADFYEWPHIKTFNSGADLAEKIALADLDRIHIGMKKAYEERTFETFTQWCDAIPQLG